MGSVRAVVVLLDWFSEQRVEGFEARLGTIGHPDRHGEIE